MKTFKLVTIVLIGIVFLASTCKKENGHYSILFINSSNKRLYVRTNDSNYPDTLIRSGDVRKSGSDLIVEANSTNNSILRQRGSSWEQFYSHLKPDTLMLFVFDADALGTIPWDTIVKNYLILKRYDLTLQDLEKMNWTITYP